MSDTNRQPNVTPLGQALGRLPSGLYVLTVGHGDQATGMLASWVQQAGFTPPAVTVAIASERHVGEAVARSGRFTLNQLTVGSKTLMRHFARGFSQGTPAFEGVELRGDAGQAGPVLAGAMAYLDAEVVGELMSGDHRIFLGRLIGGALFDPATEPFVHVRANGFHY